ncbi:MAG: shikimate kinase [Bacteroidaceae bacterium]|nr:shikimate kinase [Bacteroidaceae bacterium]
MTRIFLIGYMGAGKTTFGKPLAQKLGAAFCDLDDYIEEHCGQTISEIFAEKGEEAFRTIERNMLQEVAELENVVVSCGGGTPCFFDNMDMMNACGETVFLSASPAVLKEHLLMGKNKRPLIQGKKPEELEDFVRESLKGRLPFYQEAKNVINIEVVHTDEDIQRYVNQIVEMVRQQ